MDQKVTYSPPKLVKVGTEQYEMRTVTQWSGGNGTIDSGSPINTKVQYKPGPSLADPFPQFQDFAERTNNKSVNNGWSFRPIAGPGLKQELIKTGPGSLSSQLDTATQQAVSKDAKVPLARAQQALSKVTPTKTNQALSAPSQDPNTPAANQNAAQASGDPQTGNGETQDKPSLEELQQGIKDDESKIRGTYGNWVYPIGMRSTKQDRIKFTMYRYVPKKFDPSGVATGNAFAQKRELKSPMGSVTLPIQPTISDTNTVGWGETPMDAGAQAFSGLAIAGITEGGEGASKVVEGITPGTTAGAKTVVATTFAEKAASVQGGGLLTRLTGGIVNTNLELLFTGPALRSFSFNFSMSARDPDEAKEIRNIIRLFKQGMSVKRATTNLFLMSPNIFTIRYLYNGTDKDHPWINKVKECALTSCSVNYTPEGNYATYEDGAMTKYDITLTFGELDFIYDDDYAEADKAVGGGLDSSIGY